VSPTRVALLDRRSPYGVLPSPLRPIRLDGRVIRDAVAVGGLDAIPATVRRLLLPHVTGRASTPAEVLLLGEWLAVETAELTAFWTARLTGQDARERAPESGLDEIAVRYAEYPEDVPDLLASVQRRLRRYAAVTVHCPRCKEYKPADEFGRDLSRPSGRATWCRTCKAESAREYAKRRPARRSARLPALTATPERTADPEPPSPDAPSAEKWCPRGEHLQPVSAFGRNRASRDGLAAYCRACRRR
jgi:hypothetical protein